MITISTANTEYLINNNLTCFINSEGEIEIKSGQSKIKLHDISVYALDGFQIPFEMYQTNDKTVRIKIDAKGFVLVNFYEKDTFSRLKLFVH
jgi:hypothetical protein